MTTVNVVVPWRAGDAQRERLWGWCFRYWRAHFPEWGIITCDSGDEHFTRGRSINKGAAESLSDVMVIADADTLAYGVIESVLDADRGGWSVAYPAGQYLALTPGATEVLLRRDPEMPLWRPGPEHVRQAITSYSGVLVVRREHFETVGGFDPRHEGWGCEDQSFYFAMETLVGPCHRPPGFALAPWHEHVEADRFESPHFPANDALCRRYERARGNHAAMRALIDEAASLR